jgi:23S rRNA (uracil1939-C5)-methyltransferase
LDVGELLSGGVAPLVPGFVGFLPRLVALFHLLLPVLGRLAGGVGAEHLVAGAALVGTDGALLVQVPVPLRRCTHGPSVPHGPTGSVVTVSTTDLRPDRHVAGGDTLARDPDGRVVFVRGALPGESVRVEITQSKKDFARAEVVEVLEPSASRVTPPCPHRLEGCGGCDWQHVAESAQLDAKVAVVIDALRRIAHLDDAVVVSGGSVPHEGYRTTVRVVGTDDGTAGYRHERSHDTVVGHGCLVAHPRLVELIDSISLTPGLEVTLRCSTSTSERVALWDPREGHVVGLPADVTTGADAVFHQAVGQAQLRVSAMSFFQSGADAARLLVEAVRRAAPELTGARHVVDLYAGVGLFAAAAVPAGVPVTLVESSLPAAADARVNVPRAEIVTAEVGRWRPERSQGGRGRGHQSLTDVVIADPPRSGLGAPGMSSVLAVGAATVVLVSCDPAAAARDTSLLLEGGYHHDGTEVLDLFPHTHHVETVTRFRRPVIESSR